MSDGEKIAFIENELLMVLRSGSPTTPKQTVAGYMKAIGLIEDYKQYLINKESDEQERQEVLDTLTG